ncbi:MAG: ABC transporter substrate-binding protein [Clostridiales bacterium]|nr:ABC transporter substrate-binding protein [Clostridiales bacterium]
MDDRKKKRTQNLPGKMVSLLPLLCLVLAALCVALVYDIFADRVTASDSETAAEPVELELVYAYQNPQWNSAIENVIQEFEETHTDIVINYEVNYEDNVYEDILTRRIARGELGDIVQMKTPEAYAEVGLLGEIPDTVAAEVSSVYTYDGKIYGVGAVESTWGILYNKTLFEEYGLEEPETYTDFLELCQTLKNNGITPIGIGGSDLWHMEFWVNHFFHTDLLTADADWLKKCSAGEVSWTDAEAVTMMNHLYDLCANGYVNESWLTTTDTSLPYKMTEGEIALIYTGPWTAAAIEKLDDEIELGWFYVPDESGTVYATDNLDTYWSVTAECAEDEEKYEAAMTFLTWFYSDEVYAALCEASGTFPLTDLVLDYEDDSVLQDVWESFQDADEKVSVYIGNEDTPEEFEKSMLELVRQIMDGDYSVEAGLQKIQDAWDVSAAGGAS